MSDRMKDTEANQLREQRHGGRAQEDAWLSDLLSRLENPKSRYVDQSARNYVMDELGWTEVRETRLGLNGRTPGRYVAVDANAKRHPLPTRAKCIATIKARFEVVRNPS